VPNFKEKDLYEAIISYQKENVDLEKQANKLKNKYVLNNYLKQTQFSMELLQLQTQDKMPLIKELNIF
jgi:hypothetical protein